MPTPPIASPHSGTEGKASPRKRRKRAPTAGAAADCFTCSSLELQCDRRRPYCSQCLDHGKDCSGYKTQLTWGVGVASRGKLRGLSLPVAGTKRLASSIPVPKTKKKAPISPRKTKPQNLYLGSTVATKLEPSSPSDTRSDASMTPISAVTSNTSAHGTGINSWRLSPQIDGPTSAPVQIKLEQTLPSPASYQTTFAAHRQDSGQLQSKQVRSSHHQSQKYRPSTVLPRDSDLYYHSQTMSPMTSGPEEVRRVEAHNDYWAGGSSYTSSAAMGGSIPGFRPSFSQSFMNFNFGSAIEPHNNGTDGWHDDEAIEDYSHGPLDEEYAVAEELSPYSVALASPSFGLNMSPFAAATAIGKTPRMQYLINYYTEVISPVIVAFDGPTNPYRTHILRLAAESETLQHAISALSASNLRQRRATGWVSTGKTDPARRSSIAHLTLANEAFDTNGSLSLQEQVREETHHRSLAISALNAQLADPHRRKDDSTLAILLILCLFHICDSGVAKFQTQFAGVKKLLKMRGEDLNFESRETKWFTRMFTWFDAMTATVNDREGQLQGYHLDVSALSDEEWTLENLAGCDGQLFKTIAKLGRLNVLSQGKPVESTPTIVSRPMPLPPTMDYANAFDGNGWARFADDDYLFSQKTQPNNETRPATSDQDIQTQFWREWREIRHTLQTWHLDTTLFDHTSMSAPLLSADQRLDLLHISESFRYSALLYTERLASPATPSADPKIQVWVQKALESIRKVKSDVYLLWPLFITGSECVSVGDREIIRERCLDIQKDSGFFNNASCLELLEKVWRASSASSGGGEVDGNLKQRGENGGSGGGFRFRDVMRSEGCEGEYIVV